MFRFLFLPLVILTTSMAALKPSDDPNPYPEPEEIPGSLPQAVHCKQAMVSAAHPLAAKIGVEIMQAGGNAIDATVAVQMALNVVEPQSSGIGGGSFIVYYDALEKKTYCIDGREETPAGAHREDFLRPDGKVISDDLTGCRAAGVPGTVAGVCLAHKRWGKLPLAQVIAPAIKLAEEGIGVTPRLRDAIEANRARFVRIPSSKAQFLEGTNGSVPEIGTVLKFPELAQTFRRIAEKGPAGFYEGTTADLLIKAVQNCPIAPGHMTHEDLLQYRAVYREPTRFSYRGYDIVGMPPPSSGTITLALMLNYLETIPPTERVPGSLAGLESWSRAESMAFADRNAYLGDQDWAGYPMKQLLDPVRLAERRQAAASAKPGEKIKPGHSPGDSSTPADSGSNEGKHTTHFSIVDAHRNIVACTTTIEHGMGCGVVVPGLGFVLNNELTDFDLKSAEGPNMLDPSRQPRKSALGDDAQSLGGKRPRSSMTPLIVFKDGKPVMTIGSPGGPLIISIVAECLCNVLDHGMDMQEAINAPRSTCRNGPIQIDGMFKNRNELVKQLQSKGWKVAELKKKEAVWGGAHGIRILPDATLEGGADPRREGAVRGW